MYLIRKNKSEGMEHRVVRLYSFLVLIIILIMQRDRVDGIIDAIDGNDGLG